jgi:hypothetical protein
VIVFEASLAGVEDRFDGVLEEAQALTFEVGGGGGG